MVNTLGEYAVCCQHRAPVDHRLNLKDHAPNVWWQSDYLDQVRQSFLHDRRHPGCQQCWTDEDSGFDSMRTRTAKEYKILGIEAYAPTVMNAEIQLGNLCNLTCIMCNEYESSAILAENKKLGINTIQQSDIDWNEKSYHNVQQILALAPRVLNLRGGEPVYNKAILSILENLPADQRSRTMIHLTTNATVWNDRWAGVLAKFRQVRMMISVDATESVYEYIRFPAKWTELQTNVSHIKTLPNVRIVVNSVVQNLNIMHLGKLIEWCRDNDLYLIFDRLKSPKWLAPTNLPPDLRGQAIHDLKTLSFLPSELHLQKFIESCIHELSHEPFDIECWQHFLDHISMRERLRGNDHRSFLHYQPIGTGEIDEL